MKRSAKGVRIGPGQARPSHPCLGPRVLARRFACLAGLFLAAHLPLVNLAVCADYSPTEFQVKAAYLFNFLKFVEWPADAPADLPANWVIGIVGDSPVGGELQRLAEGKSVEGRGLLVKKFRATDDLRGCNILFVSASEEKHLLTILNALQGTAVLTVADLDHFIERGGMIQFVTEGPRVRMDIDVGATSRARLKVSSKLLALAQAVTETVRSAHK
jgi:hypothetical protein